MAKKQVVTLEDAVATVIASGLSRPDAWAAIKAEGVDCTQNAFRAAFRRAQHEANRASEPRKSVRKK